MTEAEWLVRADSDAMLEFLRDRGSPRKLRLFAVAACVRGWSLFLLEPSRNAVVTAERFADGEASEEGLRAARADALAARASAHELAPRTEFNWWGEWAAEAAFTCAAREAFPPLDRPAPQHDYFVTAAPGMAGALALVRVRQLEIEARLHELPDDGTFDAARQNLYGEADAICTEVRRSEYAVQSDLLRDIFGNPFRTTTFDLAWRTDTVRALAANVYETGDFGATPILADALQDAGCDDHTLLGHLRDPKATHVRGCWALDLVLGKT